MIGNFQLRKDASLPWLEVTITKDGRVPLFTQTAKSSCSDGGDPNAVDLTDADSVYFEFLKCGRNPSQVATQGQAEFIDGERTSGGVRYKWHPIDTSLVGFYYASFVITFKDGTILKWPYALESLSVEVI